MEDVVAAAVAGGAVSTLATALWTWSQHALAWRDIRTLRTEVRVLRNAVARHGPRITATDQSLRIRPDLDVPPVSPYWFEPDFPTLLRFQARSRAAVAPVPDASAGPAG